MVNFDLPAIVPRVYASYTSAFVMYNLCCIETSHHGLELVLNLDPASDIFPVDIVKRVPRRIPVAYSSCNILLAGLKDSETFVVRFGG